MIKKILLGLGLLSGMVLIPHALYAGSTRIIEADQIRSGAALLSLPTATQTVVGTTESQTLTNKTLTSPAISSPTGLVKGDVGLGNVDNTSDATKNAASVTLTNKTLTSPVINSPTGLVKADVGLGNVDNTSDATKNAAAVQLTNKDIDGGTASNTSRLTIPKNTLANATALTRKEGTIIYATDQAKPYYDNGSALVAVGSGSGSGSAGYNTIQNTDAETDTSNWTESGGTFTRTNTAGELLLGAYSFKWTPSAAQNLRSAAVTIPDGLYGRNCYASVIYKTASTDYTMQILDGSNNVLGSYAMPAASTAKIAPINFVCPTSGSIKLGFVTTASAVQLDFDSAFLGEATNITTSTNVTDWQSYTPTIIGFGSTTVYDSQYKRVGDSLKIKSTFLMGTASGSTASFSLPSGLTLDSSKLSSSGNSVVGFWEYNRTNGSTPKRGPILAAGGGTVLTFSTDAYSETENALSSMLGNKLASSQILSLVAEVPILGWSAEPAFRPDLAAVSWSGYHANTCSWARTNTSFGAFTDDASCTLTERTNRNFGTVSTSGSVSPAITFTPARIGRYYVCATVAAISGTAGNSGAIRLWDGTTEIAQIAVNYTNSQGQAICGIYNVTSTSAKTLTLQGRAATSTISIMTSSSDTSIDWSIFALDQGIPAPILLGSVTSNSSAAYRMESVSFGGATEGTNNCTADPCTIYRKSGGVSSITRNSTGTYTINFLSGTFSAAPTCTMSCNQDGTGIAICNKNNAGVPTSTAFQIITRNTSNTAVDTETTVICMGPN